MIRKIFLSFISFCVLSVFVQAQEITFADANSNVEERISSPDGKLQVAVGLDDGKAYYSIRYGGKEFLQRSPLGLTTSIGDFYENMELGNHPKRNTYNETYTLNRAKVSRVDYEANELSMFYVNPGNDTLQVTFRVSNHDVAFRYTIIPDSIKNNCLIYGEYTGFKFPEQSTTFLSHQSDPMIGWEKTKPSYEEPYTYNEAMGTPSMYGKGYTFPGLFKIGNDGWALLSETGVDSRYVGTRLSEGTQDGLYTIQFPQEGENNSISGTYAAIALPGNTSWKTITVSDNLNPIAETTVMWDVVKPLYEPAADLQFGRSTWSWIVWQDRSINYEDQMKYIDLAAALNFEFVLVDNWWDSRIGHDGIEKLAAYAKSKGVSLLLWYNTNGYWNDAPQGPKNRMDTAPARKNEMKWMQRIGIKGIKVDFFGGDKQQTMKLYEDILSDANEYGLVVTFHGCTLPRGWERMYPNYVSSEAVLASENLVFQQDYSDIYAYTATMLPFTRNAVGAMDFGQLFLNEVLSRDQKQGSIRKTTEAFELATATLFTSPVQHYAVTPNNLDEQPDFVLDYIREVPTVWDETVLIEGYPGKYCVMARRHGEQWHISAVNGEKAELKLTLDLPMLSGKNTSVIYDGKDRKAAIREAKPNKKGKYEVTLLPEGGAVFFTK